MTSKPSETRGPPKISPATDAITCVAVIHLIFWMLTGLLLDGGVACFGLLCALAIYWTLIGLLRSGKIAQGRALALIVVWSSWMPLVGCIVWKERFRR